MGTRMTTDMTGLVDRKHILETEDQVSRINLADLGKSIVNQHRVDQLVPRLVHQSKLVNNFWRVILRMKTRNPATGRR